MTVAIDVLNLDKDVRVGFWGRKKTLLRSVTFQVPRGSTVGFIGANGAGKSTTLKHIIGASRPTAGSVRVFGEDPALAATRRRLGYMPELPYLPPTLTAGEICRLHGTLCGVRDPDSRIAAVLELIGLTANAHERVGTFSKGMQTRLSLGLALLPDPDLLVLDEPMSGLDPVGRQLVRAVLQQEGARKKTILFSSHVLSDVEALCDRVVVIDKGRVVFSGPTATALSEPTHRATIRVRGGDNAPAADGVTAARREGDTWLVTVEDKDALDAAVALRTAGYQVLAVAPDGKRLEDRLVTWMSESSS
jgi:ABC-2 type transport system ATP-binding protein